MCAINYLKRDDKPYQNLIDEVDKAIAGANRDHHKTERKDICPPRERKQAEWVPVDNDIAKFIYEEEMERKCGKCDS